MRHAALLLALAATPALPAALPAPAARPGAPARVADPAPGAPAPASAESLRITLIDEPLPQVIALVERLTGKTFITDPAIPKTKLTFQPPRDLTRAEALVALESLLALHGVALTPLGDKFIKAVPTGPAAAQSAPELHLDSVAALPPSDRIVARLFALREADATALAEKIRPLLSSRATVLILRENNGLLVTESLSGLIRLESLIRKLDAPTTLLSVELRGARADLVAAKLKSLLAGAYKRRLRGDTVIDALESGNRLAIATDPVNEPVLRELISWLDIESGSAAKVEVFPLRHAEAAKVATLIGELNGRRGAAGAYAGPGQGTATTVAQAAGDERFSASMSLVADERSNSLVVQGTPDDLAKLAKLIPKLDVSLPQVRIEATIVEVSLAQGEVSGLDTLGLGFKANPASGGPGARTGDYNVNTGTAALPGTGDRAFGISASVKELSLAAVLNKSELRTKVNVLSSPTIVTTHNKKALINVSQGQPIITGSTSDLQNPTAARSSVTYRDIGIKLEVTPRISSNGVIQMEVLQTVENVTGTTLIDGNNQPIIGKREANSLLSANDRETIILAGLQSTNDRKTKGSIWLLGSIPWLGPWLFQPETVSQERRELIIFLKPYVVDPVKQRVEPAPGLRPDSLTGPAAQKFIDTGIAPSALTDWEKPQKKDEGK